MGPIVSGVGAGVKTSRIDLSRLWVRGWGWGAGVWGKRPLLKLLKGEGWLGVVLGLFEGLWMGDLGQSAEFLRLPFLVSAPLSVNSRSSG
jgi:hypothetical protein